MINLYNKKTGGLIGEITQQQLDFLIDQFEEEFSEDQDYSVTSMELDYFTEINADPGFVEMLRTALGSQPELIIMWKEE